jgi:phosphoserine phosphatase RsbU/P
MTLQTRTLLLVAVLVLFAVVASATPLTLISRDRQLDETRQDASRLAGVLARSAAYSDRSWRGVERAIGKQMVVQASLTAEFVAAAEGAGMSPAEINAQLRGVTRRTTIDEFWTSDPQGHAYIHSVPGIDFTFSPDPREQPQASAFWPLLKGQRETVIQRAQRREVDNKVFKYAGVGGVDEPRIVQVGYEASYLAALRRQVGLVRLVEQTVGSPGVVGIRVVNNRLGTRVFRSGEDTKEDASLNTGGRTALDSAVRGQPRTFEEGDVLTAAAPIRSGEGGDVIGGVLVSLSIAEVNSQLRDDLLIAIGIALAALGIGLSAAVVGARRVTRPVGALTAAAVAVEGGSYTRGSLDDVAARPDEIGRLAEVFDRMAREVRAREERLRREIKELSVQIDPDKRRRQVSEITETDYFRDLQRRAKELRGGNRDDS